MVQYNGRPGTLRRGRNNGRPGKLRRGRYIGSRLSWFLRKGRAVQLRGCNCRLFLCILDQCNDPSVPPCIMQCTRARVRSLICRRSWIIATTPRRPNGLKPSTAHGGAVSSAAPTRSARTCLRVWQWHDRYDIRVGSGSLYIGKADGAVSRARISTCLFYQGFTR